MRSISFWFASVVLALLIGGCGGPNSSRPQAQAQSSVDTAKMVELNSYLDPCATRLHSIEGALLDYYVSYHHWPASLQELRPIGNETLELACPVSGKPYIYNRLGMERPGDARKLLVYDATPAHQGTRWGIAMDRDLTGGNPVPEVISIPEAQFRAYRPAPPPAPPQFPQRPVAQPPVVQPQQ